MLSDSISLKFEEIYAKIFGIINYFYYLCNVKINQYEVFRTIY